MKELHLPVLPAQIIGAALWLIGLVWLVWFANRNKLEIYEAAKGDNGKLDWPEFIMIIWAVFFTILVPSDVLLGLHASAEVWYSMDAIMLFSLGGRVALSKMEKKEEAKGIHDEQV